MSMTKYMHSRNIYKTPPNFKQLAIEFPEFRKHVKQELSGKVTLDFKDISALKALSCTLLKKDFGLNVEMPLNKLIPTIPLRLNYILWIEDLIEISGKTEGVKGIDIGTGASCVYPLIIAKKNGWMMLATEIDTESYNFATENVERNNLNTLVNVKKIVGESLIKEAIGENEYDFCMCNPPFFASPQETIFEFKSRKDTRPRPKNAFSAASGEVVVNGGEVEFITKLIKESKELQQKVRIYSSMIGHKVSLVPLKKLLREMDVISFKQTEFCQGNTTRWGLAWTYCDIDLRKVPEATLAAARKEKHKHPYHYVLPTTETEYSVEDVSVRAIELFKKLQIDYTQLKQTKNVIAYNLIAHSNTWSHQRRKRREEMRLNKNDFMESDTKLINNNEPRSNSPNLETTSSLLSEMKVRSPGSAKREHEDDEGYYNNKKIKLVEEEPVEISKVFVESSFVIRKDGKGIHVELIWIDGIAGKDVLHQVLQYFKNNLKLDEIAMEN